MPWRLPMLIALVLVLGARSVSALDLSALAPGMDRYEVERRLADAGVLAVEAGDRSLLPSAPLVERVFASQRARLEFDDEGRLLEVAIQLLPAPGSRGKDLLALYEGTRAELLRQLGRPAWERREGEARPDRELWALGAGDLVRVVQWQVPHTVRLAIPPPAAGRPRVEVLLTARRAGPDQAVWAHDF